MRLFSPAMIVMALAIAGPSSLVAQDSPYDFIPGHTAKERPTPGTHSPYEQRRGSGTIGGRPGASRPRVPMHPHPQVAPHLRPELTPPPPEPLPSPLDLPNPWTILFEIEDPGPADGLTLEAAIDRLVSASIALKARALDIPQADADVLTAGLHANPIVYADGQLLPYRRYNTTTNPGGPSQYDLNVAYPVDLSG